MAASPLTGYNAGAMSRCLIVFIASFAFSAAVLLARGDVRAGEKARDESLVGLLVRETATPANSLLRQADALREKGEFGKAIAGYQEVLRKYPDALFPVTPVSFEDRVGVTYVSVRDYVEEQLGSLPEEARELYNALYESPAKALLDKGRTSRDHDALREAARRFPLAPSGMEALGLLARWNLQSGRWEAASSRFRALLRRDRFRWDRRDPEILSLGLALFRQGRSGEVIRLGARARERIGGGKGKALEKRLKALGEGPAAERALPRWVSRFGVDAQGLGETAEASSTIELTWSARIPRAPGKLGGVFSRHTFKNRDGTTVGDLLEDAWRPIFPLLFEDRVYLHNGIAFRCHDLLQGEEAVWRTRSVYAGGDGVGIGEGNFEPNRLYTATRGEGAIFVLMEVPPLSRDLESINWGSYQVIPPIPRRRVAALDERTGKVLWEAGAQERPLGFLDKMTFTTAPLALEGRLYLAGAIFEGIPTAFVVCLDAEDGSLIWSRRVCAGSQELNMFGRPVREYCGSPLSALGDALYFCTNLGAVASLRLSDGAWRWLFRYPPIPRLKSRTFETVKSPPSWQVTPPIAAPERIVVAPADSMCLYALDPDAGTLKWVVARGKNEPRWGWDRFSRRRGSGLTGPFYLLGVSKDRVVVHGRDVEAYHLRSGKLLWRKTFATDLELPAGRGALADGKAYVPTRAALYVFDVKTGDRLRRKVWQRPEDESGNVVVAGGYLVTVSKTQVNCYFDRRQLHKRIRKRAEERPEDPAAALRAGRICLREKNLEEALRHFRRALEHAGGSTPFAEEARFGLYEISMAMGRAAWRKGNHGVAVPCFRRALEHAAGTDQKIRALLRLLNAAKIRGRIQEATGIYEDMARRFEKAKYPFEGDPVPVILWAGFEKARFLSSSGRPAAAVSAYQSLLETHGDETFSLEGERGTVFDLAVDRIERLKRRCGDAVYRRFEEEAARLFREGETEKDPAPLREIVRRFPNASQYGPALMFLGRIHLDRGRPAGAVEILKRHLRERPRSESAAAAMVLLVRALEAANRRPEARRVLMKLKRRFPRAVIETPEGGKTKAGGWAEERLGDPAYRNLRMKPKRERLDWEGAAEVWETSFTSRPVLLPLGGARPGHVRPMVLARLGREIQALEAEDGAVRWTGAWNELPREAQFVGSNLVIRGTYGLRGVDPDKGGVLWSRPFPPRGIVRGLGTGGEVVAATVSDFREKSRNIWLVVLDGYSGEDLFPPKDLGQWGGRSVPTVGLEVVVAYIREGHPRLYAFDLIDGRELFARGINDWLQCVPVLFENLRRVVYATPTDLVCLDLGGERRWSVQLGEIQRDSLLRAGDLVVATRAGKHGRIEIVAVDVKEGAVRWRSGTVLHRLDDREAADGSIFLVGMRGTETRVLKLKEDSGEIAMNALVHKGSMTPPEAWIGRRVGVVRIHRRDARSLRTEKHFSVFDLGTGKILEAHAYRETSSAEGFQVAGGRLVFTREDSIVGWGK